MISDDINYIIEGILRTKRPPNQKIVTAQNLTAALAPQGAYMYAMSRHLDDPTQIDGQGLTQFQQARDWLNSHGGLSKENIFKNIDNPAISDEIGRAHV